MIALVLCFVDNYGYAYFINNTISSKSEFFLNIIVTVLLTISVIATILSGWEYLKNGKDLLKD